MLIKFEKPLLDTGIDYIAGVDEVGRGALAGPMVVGAAILDPRCLINNDVKDPILQKYEEIKDSKLLTPKKRKELSQFLKENVISYSIQILSNKSIDEWGISKCTQIGFYNSVKELKVKPQHVLTDAFKIKAWPEENQTNIIGGDKVSITIAAASIVAKVFRDTLMEELDGKNEIYQRYGFAKHKGYGTSEHIDAILKWGICDLHRKSFNPVRNLLEGL